MAEVTFEFIECNTVQISYDVTGKATVSFVVLRNNGGSIDIERYKSVCFGHVNFTGVIMTLNQKPILGSNGWYEWQVQMQGVGNRNWTSSQGAC